MSDGSYVLFPDFLLEMKPGLYKNATNYLFFGNMLINQKDVSLALLHSFVSTDMTGVDSFCVVVSFLGQPGLYEAYVTDMNAIVSRLGQ